MQRSFILLFVLLFSHHLKSQCDSTEYTLTIRVSTDNSAHETSWKLANGSGDILAQVERNSYQDGEIDIRSFCIKKQDCILFTINDQFGDGGPSYRLSILENGESISFEEDFTFESMSTINCVEASACEFALDLHEGDYFTDGRKDYWFSFKPDSIGSYKISTCQNFECDTKIWLYDRCDGVIAENNTGTIYYNNDNTTCNRQAIIPNAQLKTDRTYFIRIGTNDDLCLDQLLSFSIKYNGPTFGCTDSLACNFNPLASHDDGSCLPQGSADCPSGPDLWIVEESLINSLSLDTYENNDPCLIQEACLKGFGIRDILRFDTHIKNIGSQDFIIGDANVYDPQFSYDNCHGHFHYNEYAEYLLFDEAGKKLPLGFKAGFCVSDLICPIGASSKYGCEFMGLTAGCEDIYEANIDCQWIDITDVPAGKYTLAIRVNWDNGHDALGRPELRRDNNWAQACFELKRDNNQLTFSLQANCDAFVDCNGMPYGNAEIDCAGNCGGNRLMGDLDDDQQITNNDINTYLGEMLNGNIDYQSCYDLDNNGEISVYEIVLLSDCLEYDSHPHNANETHDHCNFPQGIYNPNEEVGLMISKHNLDSSYVEISILNPNSDIIALDFSVNGIEFDFPARIELIYSEATFIPELKSSINDQRILIYALNRSTISRSSALQPLLRIYYAAITAPNICLSNRIDAVNYEDPAQRVKTSIIGDCISSDISNTNSQIFNDFRYELDAASGKIVLYFDADDQNRIATIYSTAGTMVESYNARMARTSIEIELQKAAIYFLSIETTKGRITKKIIWL